MHALDRSGHRTPVRLPDAANSGDHLPRTVFMGHIYLLLLSIAIMDRIQIPSTECVSAGGVIAVYGRYKSRRHSPRSKQPSHNLGPAKHYQLDQEQAKHLVPCPLNVADTVSFIAGIQPVQAVPVRH